MIRYLSVYITYGISSLPAALELQPDDPLVLRRRADVRGKLGLKEKAIDDYRYAILIQSQKQKHGLQ